MKDRVDDKEVENERLRKRLQPLGLTVSEVLSDGHCLYRALAHQLQLLQQPIAAPAFMTLRRLASEYMRAHPDDFLPFLTTDDGDILSPEGFECYVSDIVSEEKCVWGGQPEIVALSAALQRPITVYQARDEPLAVQPPSPSQETPLRVSFHEHYFGLGAHYNSVVPIAAEEEF
eukprot:TRINITY_DN15108_c0_g1_i2.p1 TRINITY_DN15108_c0_g1~~TRINITY_DN15108_c0_g1_i2.p1  ORF type:complete len:186 (-),score=57.16 TRINITY_DN15108_c0_g1_i2:116-637(-)